MDLNNKSVNAVKEGLTDSSIEPIYQEFQEMANEGMSPEEIVASMIDQGVTTTQMSQVLEAVGYSPNAIVELFQTVELMEKEKLAQQQASMQAPSPEQPISNPEQQNFSDEEIQRMANQVGSQLMQPEMQYGGSNRGSGPLFGKGNPPRPLYLPPAPAKGNLLGAAFLLDDAVGKFFGTSDKDGDGLMDGTFKDWEAKNARYKQKQLGNRSYDVDYGSNNPNDYIVTAEDLDKGKLRTNEEMTSDIAKYSRLDFDPESNQYTGGFASSENEAKMFGKNQNKNTIALQEFINNISDYSEEDKEMLLEGRKYDKGRGIFMNEEGSFGSYSPETQANLTERQRRAQQDSFRDIMLGNQRLTPNATATPQVKEPKAPVNYNQRSIVTIPNSDKPIVANIPDFRTWYGKNSQSLMGKSQVEAKEIYDNTEFKYGGNLPKAQFNLPDNMFGALTTEQLQNPDAINQYFKNMGQTNYAEDTAAVANAQLQQRQPGLGPTPEQQAAQDLFNVQTTTNFEIPNVENVEPKQPTVKRKRSIGNAIDQVKDFVKNNPAVKAFADVSQAAVMGANFANELFQEKEYNDYRNKLRNTTTADNVYTAVENPINKRGTFDANLGLAEPDNLVDYYAQAMYGKETYKSGGQFEPHIMYDPVSGKDYKANVEADHNRFAKMGFIHQDEMQQGGEIEVDNDTLAALIAAGADIEIL